MEKERGIKVLAIVALLVSVIGLSIAYAAYSATLLVSGTVTAKKSADAWNVRFTATDGSSTLTPTLTGHAAVATAATLTDTTISSFNINFFAPGDSVKYEFKVNNTGAVDATLSTITKGTLSCAPKENGTATQTEANNLCNDLSLELTKSPSGEITSGTTLASGASETYQLTITWNSESTTTISDDIVITVGQSSFVYVQG